MYTEQQIRGLAINFLRQHYKLRPRSGTSGTRVVHKPHYYKGVTIDARLAYQQPDLKWFTATVEATGLNEADEVIYRVNWFRIGMHALLVSIGGLSLYLAWAQVQGRSVYAEIGRPQVYVYLSLLFLLLQAGTMAVLSRFKDYRYIYAIAQFKRFYANAQWVAYDQRIFTQHAMRRPRRVISRSQRREEKLRAKYFHELERQCLAYGFGLMEIQADNKVRWLIEPSHIDQFAGKRSRLPVWVAAAAKAPLLRGLAGGEKKPLLAPAAAPPENAPAAPPVPTDGMTDPLAVESYLPLRTRRDDYVAAVVPAKKGRTPWYRQPVRFGKRLRWRVRHSVRSLYPPEIRKRPGYYELGFLKASLLFLLCITLGVLLFLQGSWTPERRPGQRAAAPDLAPLETARTPAESDASPYVEAGEYDHELNATQAARRNDELDLTPEPIVDPTSPAEPTLHYFRYGADGLAEQSRSCGPLGQADNRSYLLVEGRYPLLAAAQNRAAVIARTFSLPAVVLLNDCLEPGRSGYVIYVGDLFLEASEASLYLRRYQRRFGLELAVEFVD